MKPIKPKKMPKSVAADLTRAASWVGDTATLPLTGRDARAILAALEYERQRADAAEKDQATESEAKLKAWKQVAELKDRISELENGIQRLRFAQTLPEGEEG